MWPDDRSDVPTRVRRAAQCALEIQRNLHNAQLSESPKVALSIKLGIGVGHVSIVHVGGVLGRIEYLATGDPLLQSFHAEHSAVAGQVMASPEAWRILRLVVR